MRLKIDEIRTHQDIVSRIEEFARETFLGEIKTFDWSSESLFDILWDAVKSYFSMFGEIASEAATQWYQYCVDTQSNNTSTYQAVNTYDFSRSEDTLKDVVKDCVAEVEQGEKELEKIQESLAIELGNYMSEESRRVELDNITQENAYISQAQAAQAGQNRIVEPEDEDLYEEDEFDEYEEDEFDEYEEDEEEEDEDEYYDEDYQYDDEYDDEDEYDEDEEFEFEEDYDTSRAGLYGTTYRVGRSYGRRVGYARVPTSGCSCAFCMTMASRGFVYYSAKSAGEADNELEKFHPNCRCTIVRLDSSDPIIDDYKDGLEYLDMYYAAADALSEGTLPDEVYERIDRARKKRYGGNSKKRLPSLNETAIAMRYMYGLKH